MVLAFLFILGAIVGSFLNVVGLRFRSGLTLGGRSFCPTCRKSLTVLELIPIISYLFLRGRCSQCKTRISPQYPLVEIWAGVIFVSMFSLYGVTLDYLLAVLIFCVYTVIMIYDFRHKIIPDLLVYLAIFLSLLFRISNGGTWADYIVGPALFTIFGLGWLVSRGRALGFGDAKLALSIGLFLGASMGVSAAVSAFWIGTAITLPLMLFSKKSITMKSEIPFAPFMIMGAWVSLYFNLDLLHVLSFIN